MRSRRSRSRAIKIHEYQARELLRQYGIAVPQATLVETGPEAREAVRAFGGQGVVKGQVLTGGRGKAGAIRLVSSEDEAESATQEILKLSVKGLPVQRVLITEKLDIQAEYYAGVTVDREAKSVVLILSAAGGVDIEEIAANEPEKIRRFAIEDTGALDDKALTQWLSGSFSGAGLLDQAIAVAQPGFDDRAKDRPGFLK